MVPRDEKTESQIRRTARAKQKASPNPNSCASPSCSNSLGLIRQRQCAYCKNRFCSDCMAPEPWKIIEYCWDNNPHSVCKTCSSEISNQTQLTRLIEAAKDTSHNNSDNAKVHASVMHTCLLLLRKHGIRYLIPCVQIA